MLLFYIIMYMMQWCALYLTGGSTFFFLFRGASIIETLGVYGMAAFMWLIGKGIQWMLGNPRPPKFLDTRNKRIIAAVASFLLGFLSFI